MVVVLLVSPGAVALQAAAGRKPLLFLHLAKVAAKEQLVPKVRDLNLLHRRTSKHRQIMSTE